MAYNPKDDVMDSDDDEFDSDLDLDDIDIKELGQDDMSDAESVGSGFLDDGTATSSSKKDKRYFWQYNTQSKGPKGKRLCKVFIRHPLRIFGLLVFRGNKAFNLIITSLISQKLQGFFEGFPLFLCQISLQNFKKKQASAASYIKSISTFLKIGIMQNHKSSVGLSMNNVTIKLAILTPCLYNGFRQDFDINSHKTYFLP